ncbi:PREDICTED: RING-H2 zinc finger protein RHA4a-like, partial [Erythranthe guttata]
SSSNSNSAAAGSPHQYPQEIQLKLYQAFIFSIPILFSIILFLLFYLFYLKRRSSSSPSLLPRTSINNYPTTTTTIISTNNSDAEYMKNEQKNKLCTVLFDEYMKTRDSSCCVCLGEFEVKEELLQVGTCNHIFHIDCIRHWLHNNSTCPLCRSPVFLSPNFFTSKSHHHLSPNLMHHTLTTTLIITNTSTTPSSQASSTAATAGTTTTTTTTIC